MEQGVYVDVLLATNYIINMMLIVCVGKLSGRSSKRRRIVAAALLGAATSLTIFLPFAGFLSSLAIKLAASAAIVLAAFPFISAPVFIRQLFLFFAVSFSFAGIMLGIWLAFTPKGMTYYNGVVYFDISPVLLIVTTAAAYAVLTLAGRFMRGKKPSTVICETTIFMGGGSVNMKGLVDTGNNLREPFSGEPVAVCHAAALAPVLPPELVKAVLEGNIFGSRIYSFGLKVRMIPYSNVGGSGVMPAVQADYMLIRTSGETLRTERVYIGLSSEKIGNEEYSCLLNPGFVSLKV